MRSHHRYTKGLPCVRASLDGAHLGFILSMEMPNVSTQYANWDANASLICASSVMQDTR